MYESVWTRYLGLLVGHSAYAQVIVLVIFLGGMALGAFAVGARSQQLRDPLLGYSAIEGLVALLGALFHPVFVWVTGVAYDRWFPALGSGLGLTVVKWTLAAVLILPQSVLLGATFPLMSAGVMRLRRIQPGHALGLLYFANSLGAAGGVLLEGFVLIGAVGLSGTLQVAALLNLVAAVVVLFARRAIAPDEGATADAVAAPVTAATPFAPATRTATLQRVLLAVSFGTALSSFIYEIAWIRMLSLVLGSATHSFELMLSAFILGLALGAYWIRRRADRTTRPIRLLGITQWAMGLLAIATLPVYLASFDLMSVLLDTFQQSARGYAAFSVVRYAMALAVMLPATVCAGMTLPLITRALLGSGYGEKAIGVVYGVNTIGSIVGVMISALVLMPLIGLKWLLVTGAVIDLAIGIALVVWDRRASSAVDAARPERVPVLRTLDTQRSMGGVIVATLALFVGLVAGSRFDLSRVSSGVYRHGGVPAAGTYDFLHYRDGRTATVTLRRIAGDTNAMLTLSTNGKPDASVASRWRRRDDIRAPRISLDEDMSTQLLLPVITLAHAPRARRAAVIGQGSGMTSHFVLGSDSLQSLETIEIEPEMINASRKFMPANARVFTDPRSTFVIDDARSFLSASGRSYDIIISEPSNPWVSGVSGLFTIEFYERVRAQLSADGIFGQWLHLYEIDDRLVMSVLGAIDRVFPAYDVYLTSNADILIVASKQSALPTPDWSVTSLPLLMRDLRRVVRLLPEHFEAMRVAGRSLLHPLLDIESDINPVNSDFEPVLDLGTESTRFRHEYATGITKFTETPFDVAAALDRRPRAFGTQAESPANEIALVNGLALGTAIRRARAGDSTAMSALPATQRSIAHRYVVFESSLRGDRPSDWEAWTTDMLAAHSALHSGTAGAADEPFFSAVRGFLARPGVGAPAHLDAVVDFLHGLSTWNFAEASTAADSLIAARTRGPIWISTDLLREGAVTARLIQGDAKGARDLYQRIGRGGGTATLRDRALAALVLQRLNPAAQSSAPAPPRR